MVEAFVGQGWARFPFERAVADWAAAARAAALPRIADPEARARWLACEGTWFVGVDALPNGPDGAVEGAGPPGGAALCAARALYGALPLHPAQVSVVYPGYPRPRAGEGEAAFRYRLRRDAAHVDGLKPVGPDRRRNLEEQHAYILGLPLTACDAGASPMVVWEGSHEIMRAAFRRALGGLPEAQWAGADLTEIYKAARREVFETCRRVPIPAQPGEAYLVHRLALHGVAPWDEGAQASQEGRMIAYFRPELPPGTRGWLELP
ncbi:hypothetical protein [Roseovarius salinarum]|uniref:hypothetical protein n=1 Tax=Roseovarius salinarum TaxID=1981892 RepID=UPI000C34B7F0|nr:hypothetical protein [Roseovarius salinarum]